MYFLGNNWLYGSISISHGVHYLFAEIFVASKQLLHERFIYLVLKEISFLSLTKFVKL